MADQTQPVFLTVPEIKHVLEQLGQVPKKRHGQNFIHSWPTIQRILDLCSLVREDRVIEIGPGLGAFTLNMAQRVKHVHAIELNPRFADYLQRRAGELGITVLAYDEGKSIRLGYDDFASKFRLLADLLTFLKNQPGLMDFERIDLTDANRVIVNPAKAELPVRIGPKGG